MTAKNRVMKGLLILFFYGLLFPSLLGEELRVVSYNIKHGQGMDGKIDLTRIAAVIAQKNPCLVALQEVDRNCARSGKQDLAAELAKILGMEYRFGKSIDFQGGEYGVAILSRLPILETNHYPLPGGPEPRCALEVQVRVKGLTEPVSFVSVHNDWTSEKVRVGQVTELLSKLAEVAHPVILAGDFNGEKDDASLKHLEEAGWKILDKKGAKTSPANDPRKEIDFIITRKLDAQAIEHGVIEERMASDHLPIFAVWKLPFSK